jgi:predicted small integral membrane protein
MIAKINTACRIGVPPVPWTKKTGIRPYTVIIIITPAAVKETAQKRARNRTGILAFFHLGDRTTPEKWQNAARHARLL